MPLDTIRPQLEHLFRHRPVQLAYLFGSQATGHTHVDSDVDIAVLLNDGLTGDERFAERLSLIGTLSQVFHTDNVDVVLLNEASPLLAYEALRSGVLLYCVEENVRVAFQVRTLRVYVDTAPLRHLSSAEEARA